MIDFICLFCFNLNEMLLIYEHLEERISSRTIFLQLYRPEMEFTKDIY